MVDAPLGWITAPSGLVVVTDIDLLGDWPYRSRVAGGFELGEGLAVTVSDVPAGPVPVHGRRDRSGELAGLILPGTGSGEVPMGVGHVIACDLNALDAWRPDEPAGDRADVLVWGARAHRVDDRHHGRPAPVGGIGPGGIGPGGCELGWLDLPLAEADALAERLDRRWAVRAESHRHSRRHDVRRLLWGADAASLTVGGQDALVCRVGGPLSVRAPAAS